MNPIEIAAQTLRQGGIVAFPTETVYGLGADADNEAAVRRVFAVKGRPEGHPLIVHLPDASHVTTWATHVPPMAQRLIEQCWPGPLTLVLPRAPHVLDIVTGGLPTVALRVPAHPMALALLQAFGRAVAAPSANRFGRVSPTTADHVRGDLGADCDFILDGGACPIGIESTIVDCSSDQPAILRPGALPKEEIERICACPVPLRIGPDIRAPGQFRSHYAPHAQVIVVPREELARQAQALRQAGKRVFELPEVAPASLYQTLRQADAEGTDAVVVVPPLPEGLGLAIVDRLTRAAAPRGDSGT